MNLEIQKLETLAFRHTMTNELREAGAIEAVLRVHSELPKGEDGVASVTIRNLLEIQKVSCGHLLREYVCAFGSHGLPVIRRMVCHTINKLGNDRNLLQEYMDYVEGVYSELHGKLDASTQAR